MELRKPILSDKEKLLDYIKEHHDNGEINISASNGITSMEYEMWLEKLKNDEEGKNIEWGISETYILVDEIKVIGMLNIRYTLTVQRAEIYGHIGYGIRPTERRKGMATYMLKEALIKCQQRGMTEVIVGCYEDNIGSSKTIINNRGILYKKSKMRTKNAEYYKIKL